VDEWGSTLIEAGGMEKGMGACGMELGRWITFKI